MVPLVFIGISLLSTLDYHGGIGWNQITVATINCEGLLQLFIECSQQLFDTLHIGSHSEVPLILMVIMVSLVPCHNSQLELLNHWVIALHDWLLISTKSNVILY